VSDGEKGVFCYVNAKYSGAEMRKKGFTLIELLVVIAIIALLLSILMPALTKVKKQAKDVVCKSNLHQWGLIWKMCVDDNNGRFSDGILSTGGWIRGEWAELLREYWQDQGREKLLTCPSAVRDLPGENHGGPEHSYHVDDATDPELASYGMNIWAFNRSGSEAKEDGPVQGRKNEWHWGKMEVRGGGNIPLFLDSMWRGGGPYYEGGPTTIGPALDYNGQWNGAGHEMKHFCIDRHNKTINGVFFDLAVQKIPLKHLWKLKWHKTFNTKGYTHPDNGGTWPAWMQSFSE